MLNKWLLCLQSTCSACRIINSHEQTRAQFFTFFTGRMKFLQRQSLAVGAAADRSISRNNVVVSTACTRSRGPTRGCRARLSGRATRARACRRCTIVRRDTCHVANADNAHLTTSNSILCSILCALCAILHLCTPPYFGASSSLASSHSSGHYFRVACLPLWPFAVIALIIVLMGL